MNCQNQTQSVRSFTSFLCQKILHLKTISRLFSRACMAPHSKRSPGQQGASWTRSCRAAPCFPQGPEGNGGGLVLGWAEVHDSGPLHHGRTRRVPLGPRQSCAVLVAVTLHPQPESSAPAPAALCLMLSLPNSFLHDKETC